MPPSIGGRGDGRFDLGHLRVDRPTAFDLDDGTSHTHTPSFAVSALRASPVLMVPAGSTSIILHSRCAIGLCSSPLGKTNISPVTQPNPAIPQAERHLAIPATEDLVPVRLRD